MSPETPSKPEEKHDESPSVEHKSRKDSSHVDTLFDPVEEKRLIRKCDLHVLPCLALIYFLSFMDRTNIGPSSQARYQNLFFR